MIMKNARCGVDKREGVRVLVFRGMKGNPSRRRRSHSPPFFGVIYDCGAHCDGQIALTLQETREKVRSGGPESISVFSLGNLTPTITLTWRNCYSSVLVSI